MLVVNLQGLMICFVVCMLRGPVHSHRQGDDLRHVQSVSDHECYIVGSTTAIHTNAAEGSH